MIGPAASAPGDFVLLRAEMDLVLVLTACSYDLGDANGDECTDLLIELDAAPLPLSTSPFWRQTTRTMRFV